MQIMPFKCANLLIFLAILNMVMLKIKPNLDSSVIILKQQQLKKQIQASYQWHQICFTGFYYTLGMRKLEQFSSTYHERYNALIIERTIWAFSYIINEKKEYFLSGQCYVILLACVIYDMVLRMLHVSM